METPKNDTVIGEVRAVGDEYAARPGHHVAAIFRDIRALQEASDRAYVRYVAPLAESVTPVVTHPKHWNARSVLPCRD